MIYATAELPAALAIDGAEVEPTEDEPSALARARRMAYGDAFPLAMLGAGQVRFGAQMDQGDLIAHVEAYGRREDITDDYRVAVLTTLVVAVPNLAHPEEPSRIVIIDLEARGPAREESDADA